MHFMQDQLYEDICNIGIYKFYKQFIYEHNTQRFISNNLLCLMIRLSSLRNKK